MRIHLLGIGGTGMASLAGLLAEAGHAVTGSDGKIYAPMSEQIASLGIVPFEGYGAKNIAKARPELVVIGNVIRKDNPEAQEVMRLGLPFRSMPDAVSELFLKDRTVFVIAGTHGKTTSSAMAAWLLSSGGAEPGFLVGGVGKNFSRSYEIGKPPFFVIEGDEYDTAFFDKGPKFLHYRPAGLIITSIEFDHADIYRDLEHVMGSFRKLVGILPPDGLLVANSDDANVMSVVRDANSRVVTYSVTGKADHFVRNVTVDEAGTHFELNTVEQRFLLPLWGEHNLSNAVGVLALLIESGQDVERLAAGLAKFEGVRRRQELFSEVKGVSIIDDFAHHPTAVAKTIASMRLRFPKRRLWAIFEPRSNSSRRNVFQKDYSEAFRGADKVIVSKPFKKDDTIAPEDRLDVDKLAKDIARRGQDAYSIEDVEHIVEYVMRGVDSGDVILVMSNGAFDGLCPKLVEALGKRRIIDDWTKVKPSRVPK